MHKTARQTRWASAVESLIGQATFLALGFALLERLLPDTQAVGMEQRIALLTGFAVLSVLRSYIARRLVNATLRDEDPAGPEVRANSA